jgi:hypothetical protein
MAKPGKHTFPSIPLPDSRFMPGDAAAAIRKRQKQTALEAARSAVKAVTILRIKRAIVDLNHVMALLDDLYPLD